MVDERAPGAQPRRWATYPGARGPGAVPWRRAQFGDFPACRVVGQEVAVMKLRGYSSALDIVFNPNANAFPAGVFELRAYAIGANTRYLAKVLALTDAGAQLLQVCLGVRAWEVAVGVVGAAAVAPFTPGQPPVFEAIAHGRERG